MSILTVGARRLALVAAFGLTLAFALSTAATAGDKPGAGKAAPAKGPIGKAAASLEEILKAGDKSLYEGILAYVKANGTAKDAETSRKWLVDLAEKMEDWAKVVQHADEFVAAHPASKTRVEVLLSKAQALAKEDKEADAKATYLALTGSLKADVDGLQTMWAVWSEYAALLADAGDIEGAKKAYADAKAAIPHPQVAQMADKAIHDFDVIGQEPAAFPEAAKDMDGKALSLKDFAGKVLLIDFWATWCPPCRAEMPNVVAAYEKLHGQGFEIVAITLDEADSAAKVKEFTTAQKMPWRQHYDGRGWEGEIVQTYGVHSIPHTILVGKDGKIARVGARGKALEKAVEKLLAAEAPKPVEPPKPATK